MSGEDESDETEHEITAEAFVPLETELTEHGLEATQQLDMAIQNWVCSCGMSWSKDEKEEAEEHLRSENPETNQ